MEGDEICWEDMTLLMEKQGEKMGNLLRRSLPAAEIEEDEIGCEDRALPKEKPVSHYSMLEDREGRREDRMNSVGKTRHYLVGDKEMT
eukprot:4216628-Ditylum_brightwellii.AAC.1